MRQKRSSEDAGRARHEDAQATTRKTFDLREHARAEARRLNQREGDRALRSLFRSSDVFWTEVRTPAGRWRVEQRKYRQPWRKRLLDALLELLGG